VLTSCCKVSELTNPSILGMFNPEIAEFNSSVVAKPSIEGISRTTSPT
jgi:hypothetical protein